MPSSNAYAQRTTCRKPKRRHFDYYIPLRGWEEETAGDVFDYVAGSSANVFSPAVKKAKGRGSVADNPLAYIAQMAVSTIVQGNDNRVRQTFMNFVQNHPTSLVSVSEMWYRNYGTEAHPDWREVHSKGARRTPNIHLIWHRHPAVVPRREAHTLQDVNMTYLKLHEF